MTSEADLIAHIRSNTERIRAGTERIRQETAERIAKIRSGNIRIRRESEEVRQAIATANRLFKGEERVFTFEEAMEDLRDAQQGAEALAAHKLSGDAGIPLDEVCKTLGLPTD